jgi:hypothetical protein
MPQEEQANLLNRRLISTRIRLTTRILAVAAGTTREVEIIRTIEGEITTTTEITTTVEAAASKTDDEQLKILFHN